jgi:hemolysin III
VEHGAANAAEAHRAGSAHPTAAIPRPPEELFNAITHGAGCLLAAVGAAVLFGRVSRDGDRWQFAAGAIYCLTLVAAYAASTLSHAFQSPRARNTFRIADQALIFLFIAGSWTPIAATWLRHGNGWRAFHLGMWAVALGGFFSKALFAHRVSLGTVSTLLYLLLGWSPVFVAVPLAHALPTGLSLWLVAGGVCYSLGLLFFHFDDRVRYFHATWHVLVIAGSACHYFGILLHCTTAPA